MRAESMAPRFVIGQKVRIRQVKGPAASVRDCSIEPFIGQAGEVTDCYWISPPVGSVFYTYTVRVGAEHKEIVLHEDEIETLLE